MSVIERLAPDWVVMQQGPSSLPANQEHLQYWADTLGQGMRAVGAEPALFMVWPGLDRWEAYPDVLDAYLGAATRVEGAFLPAGEALRLLQERDPVLTPFGADGFHPSERGSLLAALTIAATLLGADVSGVPQTIAAAPTGREISMSEREAAVLPALAMEVAMRFAGDPTPAGSR